MISGIRLNIEVGGNVIERCPRLEILSVRHRPLDMARVHVPDPEGAAGDLFAHGDPVRIEYGYRGGASAEWQGTLRALERVSRDQVCLTADSLALPLADAFVTECYTDDSSLFVARHILGHTGLPLGRVDIPDEVISRLPVSTLPVWQAVRQLLHSLGRAYGHDMRRTALWLGADGLNLGDFDESGDLPVIATGENLIRHLPAHAKDGLHLVETALLPGLSHSRRFRLVDTRLGVDRDFRALDVRHAVTPEGIKTNIRYGREHG
ncbi:hypothetical protein BerOc1_02981 [Pseudodesulfovibrio hydrargyri]|uniref:Uncharacterized protein n=1 Tax=Pseudodesulfovibrio hydrargyri TaxID=2125990 RepID=A0A1J5MYX9_9BACT|nr:hypothetical protein [Pseudodesulfovibrio hydrargyri]OIQ51036.1 hypothetical protein BerOc1_02981 [Pseudodesulfovibrio hydrargyri]